MRHHRISHVLYGFAFRRFENFSDLDIGIGLDTGYGVDR
jgi:hypothetical protein